jgi:hypothetical protein
MHFTSCKSFYSIAPFEKNYNVLFEVYIKVEKNGKIAMLE